MTERSHGLVLGKFSAGFIGLVAMAVLITGAVAAANAPSQRVLVADATSKPTAAGISAAASALEASENPSAEASEHASGSPESTAKAVKPGASCNPSLDNKEDAAELKAEDQNGDRDDLAPNGSAAPVVVKTTEPSEPPSCLKADPDSHGDKMSGKAAGTSSGTRSGDGPGHSGGGDKGFAFPSGKPVFGFR
jgi:hypothetical protein